MQLDDILFYNINELVQTTSAETWYPGKLMSRFPVSLIEKMDVPTPAQFLQGCELRFWQNKGQETTVINLYPLEEDARVAVFFGEHYVKTFYLPAKTITPIEIFLNERFANCSVISAQYAEHLRYPSNLCRVFFENAVKVSYCGKGALSAAQFQYPVQIAPMVSTAPPIRKSCVPLCLEGIADGIEHDGNILAEHAIATASTIAPQGAGDGSMCAKKRFLAYGSSITHGTASVSNHLSYLQLLAKNLGCDVLNLGMSGACTCDQAVADYIATIPDVDFCFLEIGVNMRQRYQKEAFEERLTYLLEKLWGRKVYMTTIYTNRASYFEIENNQSQQQKAFDHIIRKLAVRYGVTLIDGREILCDPSWLSSDFVHPSPFGHMKIAENLTKHCLAEKTT